MVAASRALKLKKGDVGLVTVCPENRVGGDEDATGGAVEGGGGSCGGAGNRNIELLALAGVSSTTLGYSTSIVGVATKAGGYSAAPAPAVRPAAVVGR